ncbi:MAG: NmrA/HSCARG family protein [Chroococcidiopsidaceae cyanobacterium CP_BM_ER_R8_30]|nr:NmrA/HSCARG family protein [Chroococcidiopsidaceae cyanobacterium CP_BM_ER_R8_30]
MDNQKKAERLILVTGATGKQGGAVAHHLLQQGWQVRALTRDPQKPKAQALVKKGAEVIAGDLDDPASVEQALKGVYGVFSVQNFFETGYDGEVQQGMSLADAAKASQVQHFVYSSVGSAYANTGIPHFESKWKVEEHIRAVGLLYTILRPVALMENWEAQRDEIIGGTLKWPLDPDRSLQQVAIDDIGAFAALAYSSPERWIGREVDLAGDEATLPQLAQTFSNVIGRQVSYVQISWEQFQQATDEEITTMTKWFNDVGYQADIPTLRKEYSQLTTFEQYLRRHGWEESHD